MTDRGAVKKFKQSKLKTLLTTSYDGRYNTGGGGEGR